MSEKQLKELMLMIKFRIEIASESMEKYEVKGENFYFMVRFLEGEIKAYETVLKTINDIKGEI